MKFRVLLESEDKETGEVLLVNSFIELTDKERIAEGLKYGQIKEVETRKPAKKATAKKKATKKDEKEVVKKDEGTEETKVVAEKSGE